MSSLPPLAFVRSAAIRLDNGSVGYAGSVGYDWSRTSKSSLSAYDLNFNSTDVYPSYNYYRWIGISLRWGFGRLRCRSSILSNE